MKMVSLEEKKYKKYKGLHEEQVQEQEVSSLQGGQGGGSGGDQPPLDRLLGLQGATPWTGSCPGTEGQTSVSKESTDIEKSDGEEY